MQNSYSPIPSVGRFDGGLSQLLRGDGRGGFTPVPPAESNLVVPGDAKALAVVDLDHDGWPDFLITRNNSTTLAFRNDGSRRPPLALRQASRPRRQPDGVGARITLELGDGSAQMGEVYAGSGYYSQSAAACFFGWSDRNPPRRIRVRWPSGAETEHGVSPAVEDPGPVCPVRPEAARSPRHPGALWRRRLRRSVPSCHQTAVPAARIGVAKA